MASHFSSIGFEFGSRQEFGNGMAELFQSAQEQAPDPQTGRTFLWSDGAAEVWFHPDANWCIVPSFASTKTIRVTPKEWIEDDSACPYCALLSVEVLGDNGDSLYPLAVTFGNVSSVRSAVRLGQTCDIALAAFAESEKYWIDVDAYRASGDWPIGPQWFIPLGPFSAVDGLRDNSPRAMIYGIVRDIQDLRNHWTGRPYRCVTVESHGPALFDVLMSSSTLSQIQHGSVIAVRTWLCATYVS
jgi:hypothetical protein